MRATKPATSTVPRPKGSSPPPAIGRPILPTTCLRVRGDSMAPVLCDGYIIAVDTSQTDLAKLVDKIVIAWHPEKGINVSWLKIADGREALVAQSPEYGHLVLSGDKSWRVIGKVIWWIGRDG